MIWPANQWLTYRNRRYRPCRNQMPFSLGDQLAAPHRWVAQRLADPALGVVPLQQRVTGLGALAELECLEHWLPLAR